MPVGIFISFKILCYELKVLEVLSSSDEHLFLLLKDVIDLNERNACPSTTSYER